MLQRIGSHLGNKSAILLMLKNQNSYPKLEFEDAINNTYLLLSSPWSQSWSQFKFKRMKTFPRSQTNAGFQSKLQCNLI